ncbi:MAG: AEC family transporter [Bacteroidales bacterium]|nr:AEC family transporter [Bacteroidales bacterium]
MIVFFKVFESIVILFGIGIIGFTIISRKIVPIKILDVLSPLILDIALPCLIFTNIIYRFEPQNFPTWWTLPLWWIGFTIVTILLSFIGMILIKKKYRPEIGISLLYPNAIFVPMIIIQNLFGDNSSLLVELFIITLIFPVFMFNTYHLFFHTKESSKNKFNWSKFFNPILIVTVLAIAIRLLGVSESVPNAVLSITKILGNTALPLILLLIGGNVYVDFQKRGKIQLNSILLFVALKNFLFPGVVLLLLIIIKPAFSVAFLIFLLSVVPPITAVPILTNKAGGDASLTNQFLISSFLVSVISIPLGMLVFENFFSLN